jgi:hypothetical protein
MVPFGGRAWQRRQSRIVRRLGTPQPAPLHHPGWQQLVAEDHRRQVPFRARHNVGRPRWNRAEYEFTASIGNQAVGRERRSERPLIVERVHSTLRIDGRSPSRSKEAVRSDVQCVFCHRLLPVGTDLLSGPRAESLFEVGRLLLAQHPNLAARTGFLEA